MAEFDGIRRGKGELGELEGAHFRITFLLYGPHLLLARYFCLRIECTLERWNTVFPCCFFGLNALLFGKPALTLGILKLGIMA